MTFRNVASAGDLVALRLIESLLPVVDGIETAIARGEAELDSLDETPGYAILAGWLEGQRVLLRRLLDIFEREGVRPIPTLDLPFDPRRHRAVESVPDPAQPPGRIVAERRRGYQTAARVVRYAEVAVVAYRVENVPPRPEE